MRARFFQEEDLAQINDWYAIRQMPPMKAAILPKFGLIVDGACAGFLYQTDSAMSMLDGFIANPLASGEERERALDLVTEGLMERAKELGFLTVVAQTKRGAIRERCKKY